MTQPWARALEGSTPGTSVLRRVAEGLGPQGGNGTTPLPPPWPPDPDGTGPRSAEDVSLAVQRRLLLLPPAARRACLEEFGRLARISLGSDSQGVPRSLMEAEVLEWRYPGTLEALRAAWILAETDLEAADPEGAWTWLDRSARHLRILGPTLPEERFAELQAAQGRREALLVRWVPTAISTPAPNEGGAWDRARAIGADRAIHLLGEPAPDPRGREPFGPGPHPSLSPLEDGRVLVQTSERVHLLDLEQRYPAVTRELTSILPHRPRPLSAQRVASDPLRGPGAAPWPLLPCTFEGPSPRVPGVREAGVVLVHGRSEGSQSNALLCLDVPRVGLEGAEAARLRWGIRDGRLHRPDGTPTGIPDLAELADLEFQPGPRIVDGRVLVGVRRRVRRGEEADDYDREQEAWLVAFDLRTGAWLWSRPLGRGVELTREGGRFRGVRLQESAGDPLAILRGGAGAATDRSPRVFVGTNLGFGALLDATDGRLLWSLRTPRRDYEQAPWAWAPPRDSGRALAWTPRDGERLHWLRSGPDLSSEGLRVLPGRAKGGAEALLGARGTEVSFLARSGRYPTLSTWDAEDGSRRDALHLDANEAFSGHGLVGIRRAWISTQRALYLLDLEREGLLLAARPWAPGEEPGTCFGVGDRVLVLGPREIRVFDAVP